MKKIIKKMMPTDFWEDRCIDCGNIYKVYSSLYVPIECEKCRTLVWFETRDHPDRLILLGDKQLEEKYKDPDKFMEVVNGIFEKKIPPCPECGSKLKLYDHGSEPSPLHCPKCGSIKREEYNKPAPPRGGKVESYWLVHELLDEAWSKEHGIGL